MPTMSNVWSKLYPRKTIDGIEVNDEYGNALFDWEPPESSQYIMSVDVALDNDMTAVRQINVQNISQIHSMMGIPAAMLNSPPKPREPKFTPFKPFRFYPF